MFYHLKQYVGVRDNMKRDGFKTGGQTWKLTLCAKSFFAAFKGNSKWLKTTKSLV